MTNDCSLIQEDYIHDDIDIDMDLDAMEQLQRCLEEEAREEVVNVNVDNSTLEEDHNEKEDSDMDEDMELYVDDMSHVDEYIEGQNIGELDCEHKFHQNCMRKRFMQKNIRPMCKRTGLAI
ncbi:unnamed protein product [Fraxinus pennsylvanica]|uniref:RING-type domain-containing protein n=1 Tax=Fraxinus pennsylvanica TaxID=56036 RepID=A0AAD1YXA7_9LAMI|nr:unnamed protein product [Fraxinus pennsylvanica]